MAGYGFNNFTPSSGAPQDPIVPTDGTQNVTGAFRASTLLQVGTGTFAGGYPVEIAMPVSNAEARAFTSSLHPNGVSGYVCQNNDSTGQVQFFTTGTSYSTALLGTAQATASHNYIYSANGPLTIGTSGATTVEISTNNTLRTTWNGTTGNITHAADILISGNSISALLVKGTSSTFNTYLQSGTSGSFCGVNVSAATADLDDDSLDGWLMGYTPGAGVTGFWEVKHATPGAGARTLTQFLALDGSPYLYQPCLAAAPTDGNIPASRMVFYLDEGGSSVKIRVRQSGGTYKTATIAMV